MKSEINKWGKPVWSDVTDGDKFGKDLFYTVENNLHEDVQVAFHSNLGSITVLDRLTGYGGSMRDTETGYKDSEGRFWLASGGLDVRGGNCETIGEAIQWIKDRANTCVGITV